jgi:hypothetical protein
LSVDSSQPVALSIVVPTYNERDRLPDLVAAVFAAYNAANLKAELHAGAAADARQGRDLGLFPDSSRPRAPRAHLLWRLQDLPGAARPRAPVLGRRGSLRLEGRTAGESKMNLKEAMGYLEQLRDLKSVTRQQPPLTQRYRRISTGELA